MFFEQKISSDLTTKIFFTIMKKTVLKNLCKKSQKEDLQGQCVEEAAAFINFSAKMG